MQSDVEQKKRHTEMQNNNNTFSCQHADIYTEWVKFQRRRKLHFSKYPCISKNLFSVSKATYLKFGNCRFNTISL